MHMDNKRAKYRLFFSGDRVHHRFEWQQQTCRADVAKRLDVSSAGSLVHAAL